MDRRAFLCSSRAAFALLPVSLLASGCRGKQHAHILDDNDDDMVGSHTAGSAVFEPLVQEAVGRLLGKEMNGIQQVALNEGAAQPKSICFVGVENRSAEELGDFKEQLFEIIDASISSSMAFSTISRRYVEAGLRETRLRPDDLFQKRNQRFFQETMEAQGQPFDYLLFAKITSGTTESNGTDYQRDYLLTMELVNIHNGRNNKQQAKIRKGYHKSVLGRARHF